MVHAKLFIHQLKGQLLNFQSFHKKWKKKLIGRDKILKKLKIFMSEHPNLLRVFYGGSEQRIKIIDGTPESSILKSIKKAIHITENDSKSSLYIEYWICPLTNLCINQTP